LIISLPSLTDSVEVVDTRPRAQSFREKRCFSGAPGCDSLGDKAVNLDQTACSKQIKLAVIAGPNEPLTAAGRSGGDQEPLSMLFKASPNGVMSADDAGRIVQVNDKIEKMFGYRGEELTNRGVELLVPMRLRQAHLGLRSEFAAAPENRHLGTGRDLLGLRKDGSEFPVEIGLNPTTMRTQGLVIVAIVDITHRKQVAQEKGAEERVRERLQVCQQLGMPAAVLRRDRQVVLVNLLFKQLHSQFSIKDNRLGLENQSENQRFKDMLSSLDSTNCEEIAYSSPIMAAADHRPMVFHLLPMEGPLGTTYGILIVTKLNALEVPSADLVAALFALAPAEARVAALIGAGFSPEGAAKKLGISVGNARTTLKHVFTKIGISRQSELAVLLTKLTLG
jgi:PAS domain S-box-containing protein